MTAVTESPLERLLARLDGVKRTKADCYITRCPAHDDGSPSLSIRETEDGTLLIKCWVGCEVGEVLAAVRLELRDLFPVDVRWKPGRRPLTRRDKPGITASQALLALRSEAIAVYVCACDTLDRTTDGDVMDRLTTAVRRIRVVVDEAGGVS